ncbi:hypothetical protein [Kordia sp.]|uniref:hypothetical protein n=1 Tax=Kordia sp. TaxID=1965332 RepID=UPI003D2D612B
MKKQNIPSLLLKKNKISNLTRLSNLVGGSETVTFPSEEFPSHNQTALTHCGTCTECISHRPNECGTNDTIRSLGNVTMNAIKTTTNMGSRDDNC